MEADAITVRHWPPTLGAPHFYLPNVPSPPTNTHTRQTVFSFGFYFFGMEVNLFLGDFLCYFGFANPEAKPPVK